MKTQLTLDDLKNTISEDFKNHYRKKLENKIEEEVRNKYHPVVYRDLLSNILSSSYCRIQN